MAVRLMLIVFLSCVLLTSAKGAVTMYGCNNADHKTLLEGYDRLELECVTRNYSSFDQAYQWTLTTNNGTHINLAICYDRSNCTTLIDLPGVDIIVDAYFAYYTFRMSQVPGELFGTLTCSTFNGSHEVSASCQLLHEHIRMASLPSNFPENVSTTVPCYTSTTSPSTVTWTLTSENGQTLLLGSCDDDGSCTSPLSPDVTLSRDVNTSHVEFVSPSTDMNGQIACFFSYNGLMYLDEGQLEFHKTAWLTGCDGGSRTLVDGSDFLSLYCHLNGQAESTVHWTLDLDNGTSVPVATCYAPNNCTNLLSRILHFIDRFAEGTSRVYFSKVPRDFSGLLTCTEVGHTTLSRSCQLNLVRVQMVPYTNHAENTNRSIYCTISPTIQSSVTWTLTTHAGQVLNLGSCNGSRTCTPLKPNITLDRYSSYSYVFLRRAQRDKSGYLTCSITHNHRLEEVQNLLTIYHRATVENCTVVITAHNWSAVVTCDVTQMFSSAGIYEYRVEGDVQLRETSGIPQKVSWPDKRPFRDSLTAYTSNSDNKQYYRGRLVHSWRLSTIPANYLTITVHVLASSSTYYGITSYQIEDNPFNVSRPTTPTHNCTSLSQSGLKHCTCITNDTGSPAGRLIWLLGDRILATGDYGESHLVFPTHLVTGSMTGMTAVCQLDWIQPLNAPFPLSITDKVDIQANMRRIPNGNWRVTVICLVTGLNPITPDMVQWKGACLGQTGFTCNLTHPASQLAEYKTVTCQVINHGHSTESSIVLTFNADDSQPTADDNKATWMVAGGGVVVAVVVVVVLVVMGVVVCRRGHCQRCPCPLSANRQTQDYENAAFEVQGHL